MMRTAEVVVRPWKPGRATKAQRLAAVRAKQAKVDRAARRAAEEAVRAHVRAFNPVKGLLDALAEGRL